MEPTGRVAICVPELQVIRRYAVFSDDDGTLFARVGTDFQPLDSLECFLRVEAAVPKIEFRVRLDNI